MSKVNIFDRDYTKLADVNWDFATSVQDDMATLHPYPARFIPQIPKELIRILKCNANGIILDPFCGSGTTLVEAQRAGYSAIGIDLNPIACLISRVKTKRIPDKFLSVAEKIVTDSKKLYTGDVLIPDIPNLDHWFKEDIQKSLSCIIKQLSVCDDDIVDSLRFVLSSIIVRVSNQESDTRYAAVTNNYTGEDVFQIFMNSCLKFFEIKKNSAYKYSKVKVIEGDILKISPEELSGEIDLVITSPPYPNAYEYWLYHKYRMWWLGYDPIKVREVEIGARPHYQKKNGQTEDDFRKQMGNVFDLLRRKISFGGHACFVIGRSIIKGKVIDNAALLSSLAQDYGFHRVANIERNISLARKSFNLKYGKIKTENILIFRRGL